MVKSSVFFLLAATAAMAQTVVNGGRIYNGALDASGAALTAPNRTGATDPATCDSTRRETFFNTTTNTLKVCTAANVWTAAGGGGGGGLADPGADGLVKRTGLNTTTAAAGGVDYVRPSDSITGRAAGLTGKTTPAGDLVGDSDSQTLTNKTLGSGTKAAGSSDWAETATPANPASGSARVYAKAGAGLCALDSSGTERCTGSGGSSPAGANGELQFKSGTAFAADAALQWDTGNKLLQLQKNPGGNLLTLKTLGSSVGNYAALTFTESVGPSSVILKYGYFTAGGAQGAAMNWQVANPSAYSLLNINMNTAAVGVGNNNGANFGTLHVRNNYPTTGATTLVVQNGPGQGTTALQQWQAAAASGPGTVLASVAQDGQATFPSVTLSGGTKPDCDATQRGKIWFTGSGSGTKDGVEVCAKDQADAYGWRTIY